MATWQLDPAHSSATFSARHMMVTTVRGHFRALSGTLEFDPANPNASSVEATLDAASIDTNAADRDNHLRSPDFLDATAFPTITFKSTRVEMASGDSAKVYGDLTIRGVTRPVVLETEHLGIQTNPWGKRVAGFTARTKINREDWGLTWNVAIEAGGVLVGKDITIDLDIEATPVEEAVPAQV